MNGSTASAHKADLTRRGFVAGAGFMAGGIAAGLAAHEARAEESTTNEGAAAALAQIKPAIGHVIHNPDLCSGCRTCEIVCAVAHEGVASSELSRIQWTKDIFDACITDIMTCKQCSGPECLAACPTGALHIDDQTGARVIDPDVCIGCRSCLDACPATPSRIRFNVDAQKCFKCDLCGGDPQCVKYCPTGALMNSWMEYNLGGEDESFVKNLTGEGTQCAHMEKSNVALSDTEEGIHLDGIIWTSHATQFNVVLVVFDITSELYDADGGLIATSYDVGHAEIPEMQSAEFELNFKTDKTVADVARIVMNIEGVYVTNAPGQEG